MSTLPPLVDSSSSDRARLLLRTARADGPRPGAAGRALTALGVAGTAATAAGAAGATAAAASSQLGAGLGAASLPMIAAKWLLVGTLGGIALASGATVVFSDHQAKPLVAKQQPAIPHESPVTPAANGDARPFVEGSSAETAKEPAVVKPAKPSASVIGSASTGDEATPAPFTAPSQAAFASPEQSKLLRDVALLDDARHALKAGDTARALTLIGRYDTERQTHILDREAQLLRIDVLLARGEQARARVLAQAYLAAFPNDAHAERLRAVLSEHK
jgi:hypothetical protein